MSDLKAEMERIYGPIRTYYSCAPIPVRDYDWTAYFDDTDDEGPAGYGPTEEDAINDLLGWIS